jgi:hypothetical protein
MFFPALVEALFSLTLVSVVASGAIWWLIRHKRQVLTLPILKILQNSGRKMPKLTWQKPPVFPYLLFLLLGLLFLLWMAGPTEYVYNNSERKQLRVHVLIDMSPSVSAYATSSSLSEKVVSLWHEMKDSSRTTLSTTHDDSIYEIHDAEKIKTLIQSLSFHRPGVRLGPVVQRVLKQVGEIDRLLVISDRDQHTWAGFQWQYLTGTVDVVWLNIENELASSMMTGGAAERTSATLQATISNVYFHSIQRVSSSGATMQEWDVELGLGGAVTPQSGTLRASEDGREIGSTRYAVGDNGQKLVSVRMTWPQSVIDSSNATAIHWEIVPDQRDAIAIDNQFISAKEASLGQALYVAEPVSELSTDDFGQDIVTVLKLLGLNPRRMDTFDEVLSEKKHRESTRRKAAPVVHDQHELALKILVGGLGRKNFCVPTLAEQTWIVPHESVSHYRDLCECAVRIQTDVSGRQASLKCDEVEDRVSFIRALSEGGAKQIGGQISRLEDAVAMWMPLDSPSTTQVSPEKRRTMILWTVPMVPNFKFGLSHGQLPLIIKELFYWGANPGKMSRVEKNLSPRSRDWPRVSDIASESADDVLKLIKQSNVPVQESLMSPWPLVDMPPEFKSTQGLRSDGLKDKDLDPSRILKWLVFLLFVLNFLDLTVSRSMSKPIKRPINIALWILSFLALGQSSAAWAQIRIQLWHGQDLNSLSFKNLAREVDDRTTLQLSDRPVSIQHFDRETTFDGWLWTNRLDLIKTSDGSLRPDVARWLKGGGFLVISDVGAETGIDAPSLDRLTKNLGTSPRRPAVWQAIPQDSELNRAFYLLETLPTCSQRIWYRYSFDNRTAIIVAPLPLLQLLADQSSPAGHCESTPGREQLTRTFVNLAMVATTTDYKRDQIHLPEILKRLRTP